MPNVKLADWMIPELNRYRYHTGVTNAELARRIGISPQHLNKLIRHGAFSLRPETYAKLHSFLADKQPPKRNTMNKTEQLEAKIAELQAIIARKNAQIHALSQELQTYDRWESAVCRIGGICRVQLRDRKNLDEFTVALLEEINEIATTKPERES